MAGTEQAFFRCISCGREVARPGKLRCGLCETEPDALRRMVAFHGLRAEQWVCTWRTLPRWEASAREYANRRMYYHRARMAAAARALDGRRTQPDAETLTREIDRREMGCASMAAHRERPEVLREARQSVIELRGMLERVNA